MLSDEAGGEGSLSSIGFGADLEGGGIAEADVVFVGDAFSWLFFEGLSSGVGVDIGELVSWLELSVDKPGAW